MIGIEDIGVYIPPTFESNLDKFEKHQIDESFVRNKIGIVCLVKKDKEQLSSDLCVLAVEDLKSRRPDLLEDVDFVCVCTQNPDYQLPQTSALVHDKLEFSNHCASFDISLGCSGYVYGLHIAKSFMEQNDLKKGLFFTSDPYSDILDHHDKSTDLLFGDAATATLLSEKPVFEITKGIFETCGKKHNALIKRENKPLFMDGREIFNFVMKFAPATIKKCIEKNKLSEEDIDLYILHQASKYIVSMLTKRMKVDKNKVPFDAGDIGNTISSTIPIILRKYIHDLNYNHILISGFGVGLSMGTTLLRKIQ
jgi:3-oxoacyl-[acyl-carrier-protein] synthase III